jgi:lysyl-tRNA synthetase class 2
MATLKYRLALQAWIRDGIRAYMTEHGYLEVDTPILVAGASLDAHVQPMRTRFVPDGAPPERGRDLFLRTSPEHAMKRLLAAQAGRIFEIARVFRQGELGPRHAPEFTLLEWYAPEASYLDLAQEFVALMRSLCQELRRDTLMPVGDRLVDLKLPPYFITVEEAFRQHAGIDLPAAREQRALLEAARGVGIHMPPDAPWDEVFSRVLVERVEPALAKRESAVVLYRFPDVVCTYARPVPRAPWLAERFELYLGGVEIVNAYGELRDAAMLRFRMERENRRRGAAGEPELPVDERLLACLNDMPEVSGAAAGVERMLMLITGARSIDEVQAIAFGEL